MNLISLGKTIALLREKKKLSQEKLSKKAGIDRSSLNKIESGERNVTFITLMKIVESLGVEFSEVFSETNIEGNELLGRRRQVKFFKLGGTWDMQATADG